MQESKPDKFLVFINRYYWPDESATAQLLKDLAEFLAASGFEISVVTSRQLYTDPKASLPRRANQNGVAIRRVWSTCFGRRNLIGRLLDYLTFVASVLPVLLFHRGKIAAFIAKTDPPLLGIPISLLGRLRQVPVIHWFQDLFPEIVWANAQPNREPVIFRILGKIRDFSIYRSHHAVVPSKDMKAYLKERMTARRPVHVFPNWARGEEIRPIPSEENPLRNEWGLEGKFVIGYSGNLGRVHEYSTFLQATEILGVIPQTRFLFIGKGALLERMQRSIRPECWSSFVFRDYQPRSELCNSLSLPDLHWISLDPRFRFSVFPSKFYGILAAGRPILFVGDPDSELAGQIVENECGYVVAPGDHETFTERVKHLIEQREVGREMGRRGRALFEANWDFPIIAAKWLELFKEIGNR